MQETTLVPVAEPQAVITVTLMQQTLLASFYSGRNARTLEAYQRDLDDFRTVMKVPTVADAAHHLLAGGHGHANGLALTYKGEMLARGLQPTTINRRLASLRSLVKMARTLGLVPWALEVGNVKVQAYRDTRGPGRHAFRDMLQTTEARRNHRVRVRDVALLRLLHDLALRRGEVVGLDVADVDLQAGTVAVLGKGRSQQELLTLPEPTRAALAAWLAVRDATSGPLFINFDRAGKGERLTGTSLYRIVRDTGADVGVKTRPHGLRHTAITEACKAAQAHGMDLEEVLDFSRHRDVKTLMIYRDRERNVQGRLAALVAASG